MNPSIVDFLNARLDEDQAAAENASQDPDERNVWSVGARQGAWKQEARIGDDREDLVFDIKDGTCVGFDDLLAYLVRFHPARVLREVAAKRRIVEAEQDRVLDEGPLPEHMRGSVETDVLALLALPYADHPDYREEWAA